MKHFFLLTGLLVVSSTCFYFFKLQEKEIKYDLNSLLIPDKVSERLISHAGEAKQFVTKHRFNNSLCLLIDMSIESGKNRFFVYDLKKDSVLNAGLVTHGRCNKWLTGRKYGNDPGCGCTSLGKYKIGYAYKGRFGLAYKLNGLDATNSNAFKRYVVVP